jgi:hypothetical protein
LQSTFAKTAFDQAKASLGIGRGLKPSGKTRFAGAVKSAWSVERCLPVIQSVLLKNPSIRIPVRTDHNMSLGDQAYASFQDVHANFVKGTRACGDFEANTSLFINVLSPIARAINCLESAHATVADVFLFWLAIMASFEDFLADKNRSTDLENPVKQRICQILNYRWQQMVGISPDGQANIYVAGFLLHPRTSGRYRSKSRLSL